VTRWSHSDVELDSWFERELVCPRDKRELHRDSDSLQCPHDHAYPIVDGIPILLLDDVSQTAPDVFRRSFEQRCFATAPQHQHGVVDDYVQRAIVGTNGNLYGRIAGRLSRYPIPEIRLPPAREGMRDLLDVGCNWGRWTIAAARRGYRPVGMDPGLESIIPARRIARQLGIEAHFVVADARYIPFRAERFAVVYSYGVLQHFAPEDAKLAIAEAARVVALRGSVRIQMAARYGLLSLIQQALRGFRDARGFEVRYWKPADLADAFRSLVGPTELSADGYLTLNPQPSDLDLLPIHLRPIIRISEAIRTLSNRMPALIEIADSIFASATKSAPYDCSDGM